MGRKNNLPEISLRTEELDKCVNCALCQSVCPTYLNEGFEGLTARGKIALMKSMLDGDLKPSASIARLADNCLTCYACKTVCPAGVRTERLWTAMRQDLAPTSLRTYAKRLVLRASIGSPKLFNFTVKTIGNLFGYDYQENDSHPCVSTIPIINGAPYLNQLAETYEPDGTLVGTVGLLIGCSCNLSTPWVVDAALKLLTSSGWRVLIPKKQVCCGAPAINNGDWKLARKLARKNIKVFLDTDVDFIVSTDATCSVAFAHDYTELFLSDATMTLTVKRFTNKVWELGKLLANSVESGRLRFKDANESITLQDSCHALHSTGRNYWRSVLNAIPNLNLIEMRNSEHCCGFGGSYSLTHKNSALKISENKLDATIETGADKLLVCSPGCQIKLEHAARKTGRCDLPIEHVTTFLSNLIVNNN